MNSHCTQNQVDCQANCDNCSLTDIDWAQGFCIFQSVFSVFVENGFKLDQLNFLGIKMFHQKVVWKRFCHQKVQDFILFFLLRNKSLSCLFRKLCTTLYPNVTFEADRVNKRKARTEPKKTPVNWIPACVNKRVQPIVISTKEGIIVFVINLKLASIPFLAFWIENKLVFVPPRW